MFIVQGTLFNKCSVKTSAKLGIFWRHRCNTVSSWALSRICEKQVLAYNIRPSFLTYLLRGAESFLRS